jgi:hypothetical protein
MLSLVRRLAPLFLLIGAGCTDLPVIAASGCGNRVIDPEAEDCDGPSTGGTCGEPGTAQACRFVCDKASAAPRGGCPGSFACGADGICRQPTGALRSAGGALQVVASRLYRGDLDQDGRDDLIALSEDFFDQDESAAQVLHFSGDGALNSRLTFPGVLREPWLLPLASAPQPRGLLISRAQSGFSVTLSRPNRSFEARNYSSIPLAEGVRSMRGVLGDFLPTGVGFFDFFPGDEILLFAHNEPKDQPAEYILGFSDSASIQPVFQMNRRPDELAGELQRGHLLRARSTEHYCPSVVFAFLGASNIELITPCSYDQGLQTTLLAQFNDPSARASIQLSEGQISEQVHLADLDRDGRTDLLTRVELPGSNDGNNHVFLAAYGTTEGYMTSTSGGVAQNLMAPLDPQPVLLLQDPGVSGAEDGPATLPDAQLLAASGAALAVGYLDGDTLLDFVLPGGIFLSTNPSGIPSKPIDSVEGFEGPVHPYWPAEVLLASWTEARVTDINGDGRLDVIAASSSSRIEVLLGNGAGAFSKSLVPLESPPTNLTVGDFDGDLLDDVAFREPSSLTSSQSLDTFAVLYGARQGVPSQVVRVGKFSEILAVSSGHRVSYDRDDRATDVGLFSRTNDRLLVTELYGSPDRSLRSFLQLQRTFEKDGRPVLEIHLPDAFAAGRFAGSSPGLVALGYPQLSFSSFPPDPSASQPRFWYLEFGSDAQVSTMKSQPLPGPGGLGRLDAGDVDGDGIMETIYTEIQYGEKVSTKVDLFRLEPGLEEPFVALSSGTLPAEISTDLPVIFSDLDGDGKGDFLALEGRGGGDGVAPPVGTEEGEDRDEPGEAEGGSLLLVRQGATGFDWSNPARIRPPGALVQDFCLLPDPEGPPRLALSSDQGLWLASWTGESYQFQEIKGAQEFFFPRALVCGDFDGDGLHDVALSYGDSIELLRGVPRLR